MSAPGSQVTPVIDLVSPNTHTVPRVAVHTRRYTPQKKFDQLCGLILDKAAQLDKQLSSVNSKPSLTLKYKKELLDLYAKCDAEARTLGIPVFRVNAPPPSSNHSPIPVVENHDPTHEDNRAHDEESLFAEANAVLRDTSTADAVLAALLPPTHNNSIFNDHNYIFRGFTADDLRAPHNTDISSDDEDNTSYLDIHNASTIEDDSDNNNIIMAQHFPTVDEWRDLANAQTEALTQGLTNLSAITIKKEIPEFSGNLEDGLTIEEWLKKADRVATTAGWTDVQKNRFYQERLTQSAATFNDTLPQATRDDYVLWRPAIITGLQDTTLQSIRKVQLKHIKQKPGERIRDFKQRIDDMYKIGFGETVANSQNAQVANLRDDVKREVFLDGLRSEIFAIIWARLPVGANFQQTVTSAEECEQLLEIRRTTEAKITGQVSTKSIDNNAEFDEVKALVKQMANLQLSQTGQVGTIAYVEKSNRNEKNVKFQDRDRSQSPGPGSYSKPHDQIYYRRDRSYSQRNHYQQRQNSPYRQNYQSNYRNPSYSNYNNQQSSRPQNRNCFYCNKPGHIKRACRKLQDDKVRQRNQRNRN